MQNIYSEYIQKFQRIQIAFSGDTDALVTFLEQLTLALKTSGQRAFGEGPETSVQGAEVVSTENGVNGSGSEN